jgi:prevent-host-death family protein
MKNRHTVPAGEFKNSCLRLIDEVSKHGIPITVTKRGRPLVRIVPAREHAKGGSLVGTIVHEDDDIFSTGESWQADR